MLKTSQYNFAVDADDGKLLLYNSRTGAFAVFESANTEVVKKALIEPNSESNNKIIDSLKQCGFLVPAAMNELEQIQNRFSRFRESAKTMTLTMLASENCNFRCPYCFIYDRRGMNMAPWVYDAVLKLIHKSAGTKFALSVNWFGGEPTLEYRNIISFMGRLNTLVKQYPGMTLFSSMVTNGYLLTAPAFKDYLNSGIKRFQVTIDGDEESHNRTRILKNGQGTFARIWANLKSIHDSVSPEADFRLQVRVNFLKGQDAQVSRLIDAFNETFHRDPRFVIYFRSVYDIKTSRNEIDAISEHLYEPIAGRDKQLDYYLQAAERTGALDNDLQLVAPVPSPISGWCSAQRLNAWTVGADGLLFKCDTYVGEESKASARLGRDGEIERFAVKHEWDENIYDNDNTKCFNCKFLPVCQGGCPRGRAVRMAQGICYFDEGMITKGMLATHAHNARKSAGKVSRDLVQR